MKRTKYAYVMIDGNGTYYPYIYCHWHKGVLTKKLAKVHRCEEKQCKRFEYCNDLE